MVGRYRPGDARQFVGQRAGHHIGVTSRQQRAHPVSQGALLVLQSLHVNPGTLNQQPSEILVTTLADPHQIGFSAGAVLPGYQANRRRKVTTASVLLATSFCLGVLDLQTCQFVTSEARQNPISTKAISRRCFITFLKSPRSAARAASCHPNLASPMATTKRTDAGCRSNVSVWLNQVDDGIGSEGSSWLTFSPCRNFWMLTRAAV